MGQGHSGAELQVGRLGVKELLGQTSRRTGTDADRRGRLMAQDHGGILKQMLSDEIFTLGKPSRALQGPEGDEGVEQALAEAASSVPAPQVGRVLGNEGR